MRPLLLRHAVIAALLLGCASTSALSTEYALSPQEHPEGIECFYSCLKQLDETERRFCLSFCDGIEVTATYEPCAKGSPALCRAYPVRDSTLMDAELRAGADEAASDDDDVDDGDSVVGDIIGSILVGFIEAAICGDCDDDDDESPRAHPDERRRRARNDSASKPAPRVERAPKPASDRRGRPRK